jgi:hypothetical protein
MVLNPPFTGRMTIEVVTVSGRAAGVELHLAPGTLSVRHHGEQVAVVDRRQFRRWLRQPHRALTVQDVTFSIDRALDVEGRLAIALPDVHCWALSPTDAEKLRQRI